MEHSPHSKPIGGPGLRLAFFLIGAACGCAAQGQTLGGCAMFPPDNIWNAPVDNLPVHPRSPAYVSSIGASRPLHPDFGTVYRGAPAGIPFALVGGDQPKIPVKFRYHWDADPGPYPIPAAAPIEGGPSSATDRHVLVLDTANCILYELFSAYPQTDGSWLAGSGAIFQLKNNSLRPAGKTSADAAGLPILPGLVRYDEVAAGEIRHAVRFTAPRTQRAYAWPARHFASTTEDANYPPMGARFRLKASVDISTFPPEAQVILTALKKYGMIVADNGGPWFLSGAPDMRWNDARLRQLTRIPGSSFEAVDVSSLLVNQDSAQARAPQPRGRASINEVP